MMVNVTGVSKSFDRLVAVNNVSLVLEKGDTLGLIGPNGAGKTTLLRMLSTLSHPDSGTITIDGLDTQKHPRKIRQRLGFMPAEFGVPRDMTIGEFMSFFGSLAGLPRKERASMIEQVLELTDLQGRDDVPVRSLSTGNKQRLLLAKTLINDPQLLILDEPASGLDPRARVEVREILQELAGLGKTIIISSHILKDLESMCSHVGVMEAGTLILDGKVDDLKKQHHQSGKNRVFQLTVPSADLESAQQMLSDLENVHRCRILNQRLEIELLKKEGNELLENLIQAEIEILGFAEEQADLEDIFIQSTEGKVT